MGPDAANLAASIAKSHEVDRSPGATQRASEVSQAQLAGESAEVLGRRMPNASEQVQREKIRRERERRRREMERRMGQTGPAEDPDSGDSPMLDVVA